MEATGTTQVRAVSAVSFDEWVAARGPALVRLGYLLTGDRAEAEDVVQDALSRVLPRWSRIHTDPDAYVRRAVVNAARSRWRRYRRHELPVAEPVEQPTADRAPRDVEMWEACRALPEPLRTALVLRYFEDLDYAAISALTGVREGSARSRVSRALARLREELADD